MVDVILTTINAILLCVAGVSVILFLLKKDVWRLLMQGVTLVAIAEVIVIAFTLVITLGISIHYPFWSFFGVFLFIAILVTLVGYFLYISKNSHGKQLLINGLTLDITWMIIFFGTTLITTL